MYGACILLGIVLATLLGERLCKEQGLNVEMFWRAVLFGLVFGLAGARLYHVVDRADYFVAHPLMIFAVWQGGLGVWGGIAGGILGAVFSLKKSGQLARYADVFAVCAPLAQAIGRWGNYFNKELFGYPTNLPWGIYIPRELRATAFKYYDHFHPLFLYESILNLILFAILYRMFARQKFFGKKLSVGNIAIVYLMGYSIIRFFLEFLRVDSWKISNFPVASGISALVFAASLALYFNRNSFSSHN